MIYSFGVVWGFDWMVFACSVYFGDFRVVSFGDFRVWISGFFGGGFWVFSGC